MNRKILRYSSKFEAVDRLKSSKNFVPEWYKNIKAFNKNNIKFEEESSSSPITTVKSCLPFLDGFTSGYTVELWTDVHFTNDTDFRWAHEPKPIEGRIPNLYNSIIPIPEGHSNFHFAWLNPYAVKLPTGYSAIIMHPSNRFDLPFTTMTGIVDSELVVGWVPFFLKKGFTGIIEKGTPMYQIVPFKRESWFAKLDSTTQELEKEHATGLKSFFNDYYRNKIWSKKDFS